jgi:tetratricopeptide (TPR) repeat protein/pimeloyl-ACP methyl ester carboxylesterase
MSRLIKIALWSDAPQASVIFVHGLGGHAYDTWRRAPDNNTFWPLWLAKDLEGISVYTMAYEAPPTNWLGTSMPLQDRAVNVLEYLLSEPGLKSGPIAFICHSLGGLIVKQIVLDLQQQKERRPEAADLLQRVTKIVFAATPHTGTRQATLLDRLRFFAWPSSIARTLVANDPALRSINVAYRGLAEERRNVLQHRVFYETQGTPAGVIVDEASADPGLPGDPPVPVDADHISIVKPRDRSSVLYARTREFIAKNNPVLETQEGGLEICLRPPIPPEQPLNVLPKLIRIAAIGLVLLIGYKGVQALISPPPPIDQQKLEQKIEHEGQEGERHHKEQVTSIEALRVEMAREKGVPAEVLAPLFENLGMKELTLDQMRQKAAEAIKAILARANEKIEASKDGADIDKAIAASRAKLAGLDTAGAEAILDKKIAQEEAARRQRLIPLLAERAAVARLSYDYPSAKATLEELLRLDPNRVWSWIDLGDNWMTTGRSGEAAEAFEAAGEAARRTKNERDLSVFFIKIGGVQVGQGDPQGARKSYSDSLAIGERLAQSDPGNAGWQHDLSISYNKIGDVQQAQGDLKAALKSYSNSLAIRERLAQSDPGNAGWQRDLSVSYEKIGDVQLAQGDLQGALKSYSDSLAIAERLAQSDPGNAGWQRDLSVSYDDVGDVRVAQGDLKAALKSYSDSLAIRERLATSDPGNAGWQRDLASAQGTVGTVQQAQGNLPGALKSYSDSLAIAERLAQSDPGNAGWQRDLAIAQGMVGTVQRAQGNLPGALNSYRDGLVVFERLATSEPGNAGWQRDLSVSYDRIGDVQMAQGDLKAALKSYSDDLAIAERLAQSDPGNAGWQRDLSVVYGKLADAYRKSNETVKARDALAAGRAVIRKLVDQHPDQAQWKEDLAWFDARIAEREKTSPKKKPARR